MDVSSYFASDYADARARFLKAASAAGAAHDPMQNPLRGPKGEKLFCDVAWLGPRDARKVLVSISATHGGEGFCGSMCQSAFFAEGLAGKVVGDGIAVLAIHAINPHGFAWVRRVTEDNVDLNRNFLDFNQPLPVNEGYRALHALICPQEWSDASRAETAVGLEAYRAQHGNGAYQIALTGGQYEYADGIFYGGQGPTWSNRTLQAIIGKHLAKASAIGVIDYHTGLGPYGFGEVIGANLPGDKDFDLLKQWFGDDVTSPDQGTSSSPPLHGTNAGGIRRCLPKATLVNIALEYGTEPKDRVLDSLRADCWLHTHGDLGSDQAKAIKAELRHCFGPDDPAWRNSVWERAVDITARMVTGLKAL